MFKENMDALAAHLENLVKTKTIIGEPIVAGNVTLIPVVTASFGFGLGGGEGNDPGKGVGQGSGGGAGAKVVPTAIIAIKGDDVQVFSLGEKGTWEKLIEVAPELISKIQGLKPAKKSE
jgi:uncharacterized spore protein YtfJ